VDEMYRICSMHEVNEEYIHTSIRQTEKRIPCGRNRPLRRMTRIAQVEVQWLTFVNTVMNLQSL
jgi:hypothetical protein